MIDKVKTLFKKLFVVYKLDLKTNKKNSFREFEKDFEAREFVRKILDERLKILSYTTNSDFTLANDYFKNREYKYLIEDGNFDEDEYIKTRAPNIYHQQISNRINQGFKIVQKKEEQNLLVDIQNCEVLQINTTDGIFEIIYKKEEETKYLTIEKKFNVSSMAGIRYYFLIDDEKFENSSKTLFLQDMKKIVKIFHLKEENSYYQNEFIEILFKDSKNITCSHRLNIEVDEDFNSVDMIITRYENIFSFKSEILDDKNKTQFNFYYDNNYFYPTIQKESKYNDYPDYSCITYGKNVFFMIDEEHIKAYNLGFLHNEMLDKKHYDSLSKDEKDRFHRFLSIAELYINSLEINQKFDNKITFDWEKEPENYHNLEKVNKFLNNGIFQKKLIYYNGEQGHPSTREVYEYSKDDKRLFYFWEIEFYGDCKIVTIKYNDDLKDEINDIYNW